MTSPGKNTKQGEDDLLVLSLKHFQASQTSLGASFQFRQLNTVHWAFVLPAIEGI